MNRGRQLRELMSKGECVIAPGAYDGLTARLIAQAGSVSYTHLTLTPTPNV